MPDVTRCAAPSTAGEKDLKLGERVMKRQTHATWQAGSQGPPALRGRRTRGFQPALLLAEVTADL